MPPYYMLNIIKKVFCFIIGRDSKNKFKISYTWTFGKNNDKKLKNK